MAPGPVPPAPPPPAAGSAPSARAAGFVLGRQSAPDGPWEYLLLTNRARGEPGFPKGHAEPGEDEEQTARRETQEETGLGDLDLRPGFRRVLEYPAVRGGVRHQKRVVYRFARVAAGARVRLSPEHRDFEWLGLGEALARLPFDSLRWVLREAALFNKDRALFALEPASQAAADRHLAALPAATPRLLGHLRGAAQIARALAEALAGAGVSVAVEATAAATLLHDVGRALGEHADHQRAGLRHLRKTPLAAYGLCCVSHFAKGAPVRALVAAGVEPDLLAEVGGWVDLGTFTAEERCAALADACMRHDEPVSPAVRFADLRDRYGPSPLIELQARRTEALRAEFAARLGRDPLAGLVPG